MGHAGSASYPDVKSKDENVSELPKFLRMSLCDCTDRDRVGLINLLLCLEARIILVIEFFWKKFLLRWG